MPFPPRPSPVQGLQAAQPTPTAPPTGGQNPQVEAAMSLLQQAVAQYGPGIIEVLKQILTQGGGGAAPMPPQGMMR